MLKKLIPASALVMCLIFSAQQNGFAQQKSEEELKMDSEKIRNDLNDKEAAARKVKIDALALPKTSGVTSVDNLAISSSAFLKTVNDNNTLIPQLYTRITHQNLDGQSVDVTEKKPTLDEMVSLSGNIATQIAAVQVASASIPSISEEVTKTSPLKAPKASKAMDYSKEALALVLPELQLNAKVVNNLISLIKSSKNY